LYLITGMKQTTFTLLSTGESVSKFPLLLKNKFTQEEFQEYLQTNNIDSVVWESKNRKVAQIALGALVVIDWQI
jgi:hypothetical protein